MLNILPKSSQARKKPPPPPPVVYCFSYQLLTSLWKTTEMTFQGSRLCLKRKWQPHKSCQIEGSKTDWRVQRQVLSRERNSQLSPRKRPVTVSTYISDAGSAQFSMPTELLPFESASGSAPAAPKILILASAYSASLCSNVFIGLLALATLWETKNS